MNCTILEIYLTDIEIPDGAFDDEDQLNVAALHLAEAINLRFGENCPSQNSPREGLGSLQKMARIAAEPIHPIL